MWDLVRGFVFNLRPYSWIDLILLGYLAKFLTVRTLTFELSDLFFISGLLCLWFFFNISLEARKKYEYRARVNFLHSVPFFAVGTLIGLFLGLRPFVFSLVSAALVFLYNEQPW